MNYIISKNHKNYIAGCETQKIIIFFAKRRDEIETVIYAETKLATLVAKNNEPFRICNGISKIVSDMSSDSKLAKKHRAGKTKNCTNHKREGK